MKRQEVKDIIACLDNERTVFHYFKDRYCFDLIEFYMGKKGKDVLSIGELKQSCLNGLLQKTLVRSALTHCGNGKLHKLDLQSFWPSEITPFILTLNGWGDSDRGRDQTSRNQCNLVLQLNFDGFHMQEYHRLVKPNNHYRDGEGPFEYLGHPVCQKQRKTMSWIRMDIDFSTNEALIEEIQNDWLRKAKRKLQVIQRRRIKKPTVKPNQVYADIDADYEDLRYYVEHVLTPYQNIWAEASMSAALRFIRDELGISNVFYHSFETGKKIKAVCGSPPRSMYTQLPKQFGFEPTQVSPEFLMQDKVSRRYIKSIKNPNWFRLAV